MLKINQKIIDEIYKHAKEEAPFEACGYLAGRKNNVMKKYAMTNMDKSKEHFTLDVNEQFKVIKEARSKGLDIIAVYHTHPHSPARLSMEDIRLANDPDITYIILSLAEQNIDIRSFKIKNGVIKKEELKIIKDKN